MNESWGQVTQLKLLSSPRRLGKPHISMDSNAILHEVKPLYNVSDLLDSLAEEHPPGFRGTDYYLRKCS